MAGRRGGLLSFQVNGELYDAKGNFTVNTGRPKREPVIGADGVHGYKETHQVAFIEGEITDRSDLDINKLVTMTDATVTLETGVGKVYSLRSAWFAGEGSLETEEGNIKVRFEGLSCDEVS
jgi:hypothetical protein